VTEIDEVLDVLADTGGRDVAVATVVATRGSTYRRAGARLVVSAAGDEVVGNISGGCLEGDVAAAGAEVLESGRPRLLTFDLTADDEAVWGWGLGCNGVIEVLVEPGASVAQFAPALAAARREERPIVVATVIEGEKVGARMLVRPDGRGEGGVGTPATDDTVRAMALSVLRAGRSATLPLGDRGRAFFEVVAPRPRLVVCGAGHDTVPLVRLAERLGWRVDVVDERPGLLRADRFTGAARLVLSPPARAAAAVGADADTFVVVMSHNFLRDADYLRSFLPVPVRYLGVLGPRARLERLVDAVRTEATVVTPEALGRIHGPAGLDLGAEGPDEVALAIVAELHAVRTGRPAGFLRGRAGPIHQEVAAPPGDAEAGQAVTATRALEA